MGLKNLTRHFLFQLSVLVVVQPTFEAVATNLYGDWVDDQSVYVVDGVGDPMGDDLLLQWQNVEWMWEMTCYYAVGNDLLLLWQNVVYELVIS